MEPAWLHWTAMGCALALSFFLSGMEAGVFVLSRLRIRQRSRQGDARARLLLSYLEEPEPFFWTILVGSTVSNFLVIALVAIGLHGFWGSRPLLLGLALLVSVFLLYAVGDLLPKLLFQRIPNRLCLGLVRPFRWVYLGLSPAVALVTWLTRLLLRWTGGRTFTGRMFGNREELRALMQESAQGLSSQERAMINRVLDLQNLRVGQIVRGMDQVVSVTTETPMSQVIDLCRRHRLTRLPVWQAAGIEPRRIVGIVSLKTLLYQGDPQADRPAGEYVKPAIYLDEDVRLEIALRRMQRSGHRMAIVLGRDRREIGIACLQDILRVVFGEVHL